MATYRMPARYGKSYLSYNQWVNIIHHSREVFALCQVQDLDLVMGGNDINDFLLEAVDAQGNPIPIEKVLIVEPFKFPLLSFLLKIMQSVFSTFIWFVVGL